jgi:UDP-N-acetylmuramyl tripeptide synthase
VTSTRPTWFSIDPESIADAAPRPGLRLDDGTLVATEAGRTVEILPVAAVPAAFGGAARHNVANALAAAGLARAMGLTFDAIREGLGGFDAGGGSNPGRGQARTIGGVHVIVDFAHNPHGMTAMVCMARALTATRRHVVLGQAGDRDDDAIAALVDAAAALEPARVVIKELRSYLRGRPEGEVPRLIEARLRGHGIGADRIARADGDLDAARIALEGARAGDLVLLFTHAERRAVEALLARLEADGWVAGRPSEIGGTGPWPSAGRS